MFLWKGHLNSQKAKKHGKNRTKVYNQTKTSYRYVSCRKFWYVMTSVNIFTSYSSFLLLLLFLSYLVCLPSFKSINSSYLFRKKYDWYNFTHTARQPLRGHKLNEPSDTLNCEQLFKRCILRFKIIAKSLAQKTELYFIFFFWFSLGWHSML